MLRSIISYLFGGTATELSLDDACAILDTREVEKNVEEPLPEENAGFTTFHKIGKITSVHDNKYVIDNVYSFASDELNACVGTKVSYISYIHQRKLNVSNVEVVLDDWDSEQKDVKSNWCPRSLACKVVQKIARQIIVEPKEMKIDLNNVSSDFVPIIGDWLQVGVMCEIDENVSDLCGNILKIVKLSPLRSKQHVGAVRQWDLGTKSGVIDKHIFFNAASLAPGYMPLLGDKVVTEIIESDQGYCSWRSIKVIPEKLALKDQSVPSQLTEDFYLNIDGIVVTDDVYLNSNKPHDLQQFAIEVYNNRENNVVLLSVEFSNKNSQCKLENHLNLQNVCIKPMTSLQISCRCMPKNYGYNKELLLLSFEEFKIGRWIHVTLESKVNEQVTNHKYVRNRSDCFASMQDRRRGGQNDQYLKGQRPVMPPRFISNHLAEYAIPEKLWDIYINYADPSNSTALLSQHLLNSKPCLNSLSYNSYQDYFHTLVHLEEIENVIAIQRYDQDKACFIQNGEYLMLEIENLSERRPSLIIGDRILATDSYNANGMKLEGYIHKVGAKHVYIKFAAVFHDSYKGEDYSITVVASRTTFRKRHQAIGLAIRNLGREVLFPSKVTLKTPQLDFVYDPYDDTLLTVNKKIKDRSSYHPTDCSNRNKQILAKIQQYITSNKRNDVHDTEDNKGKTVRIRRAKNSLESSACTNGTIPLDEARQSTPSTKLKLEWFDKSLNYYQKEAIRNILLGLARPLPYFIFGPPGTGKTVTLVETILQLLKLMPDVRILVGAPSNSAADIVAIRLIDSGGLKPGDLVRFVSYKSVVGNTIPVKLVPYSATGDLAKEGTHSKTHTVLSSGLTLGVSSSVLGRHRVTVSTCSNLGYLYNMGFPKGHFTHIVIDEAGHLIEPEAMIPLAFLDVNSGQAILAGDPQQLGPVIMSKVAAEYGLAESYLERLLNRFPYERDPEGFPNTGGYDPRLVTRLVYNYRSLPEILELPSSLFYNSELKPTISPDDSEEAKLLVSLKEILPTRDNGRPPAFVFHGVVGENFQTPDSPSWYNPQEASQLFLYVNELYRLGINSSDIGIISPYTKQIQQIRAILNEAEFEIPKIGTVEEFQGQEFKIVLLSVVRSLENLVEADVVHRIGFIACPRRLNVAVTRAQALLIIIGNPNVLIKDPHWRSVLQFCIQNEAYCGCELNDELKELTKKEIF